MKTILKWPGGKEAELPVIRQYTPEYTGRYIEPFVGGGAAFFDTSAKYCCINDSSRELINLYNCIKLKDEDFVRCLKAFSEEFDSLSRLADESGEKLLSLYNGDLTADEFIRDNTNLFSKTALFNNPDFKNKVLINLSDKLKRCRKLEKTRGELPDTDKKNNLEAALKSAYYMYVRALLNHPEGYSPGEQAAVFFFIREFCYSSMFRYNSKGEFNVPYGGISYNRKDLKKKTEYILSERIAAKLENTLISCCDFEAFLNSLKPVKEDFIFLDPPYDSDFSSYAGSSFGREDHRRLCEYLKKTPAKLLLIIKDTDFIYELYRRDFKIGRFDKKYTVSFKNRNSRDTCHLIITN